MRSISPALAAAQQHSDVRTSVQVTVENRGQAPGIPLLHWQFHDDVELPAHARLGLIAMADGSMWFFEGGPAGGSPADITLSIIDSPCDPIAWSNRTTLLWTNGTGAVAALGAGRAGDRMAVAWLDDAGLHLRSPDDDGDSWSTVSTPAGLTVPEGSIHVAWHATVSTWAVALTREVNGERFVGVYYHDTEWHYRGSAGGWQVAGLVSHPVDGLHVICTSAGRDQAEVAVMRPEGSNLVRHATVERAPGGYFGYRWLWGAYTQLSGGSVLGLLVESGYNDSPRSGGCHAIFESVGGLQGDEPILLPELNEDVLGPTVSVAVVASDDCVAIAGGALMLGLPVDVPAEPLQVVKYKYDTETHDVDLVLAGESPVPPVGAVLRVERTLDRRGAGGSKVMRWLVMRVERSRYGTKVLAVDPLGWLAQYRARRAAVVAVAGDALPEAVAFFLARLGLSSNNDCSDLEAVETLPMTLQPSESGASGLYRLMGQYAARLVPSNDGSFACTLIDPAGVSDSGEYGSVVHQYGPDGIPMREVYEVQDARRLAASAMLGLRTTDWKEGSVAAQVTGPVLPGTRPLPVAFRNMSLVGEAQVENSATAEAARQWYLTTDAIVEAGPNLGLELYDLVEVDWPALGWSQRRLRVHRVVETWERGRMGQRVYCGRVGGS